MEREDVRVRVVEAAGRLLRDAGPGALTTRAVAAAAGVQAPTIYRLFGDKDGLLDAVAEHAMAAYVAAEEGTDGDDPVADLREAWRRHIAFGLANPHLYALMGARRGPSPATEAGYAVLRRRVHRLAAAGLLRVEESRALLMVHAAGNGTVLALLDTPPDRRDGGLADEVMDAVLARLVAAAPAVAEPSVTGIAVAFATVVPELPGLSDAERAVLAEWLARSLATGRSGPAPGSG